MLLTYLTRFVLSNECLLDFNLQYLMSWPKKLDHDDLEAVKPWDGSGPGAGLGQVRVGEGHPVINQSG